MAADGSQTQEMEKPRTSILEFLQDPATVKKLDLVKTDYLTPDKVVRLTLNAINKTPFLKACTLESMIGAMVTTTALGLEPNTPLGHAYLIPFRNRKKGKNGFYSVVECQYIIGYKGYVALAHRSDRLLVFAADAVRENDDFETYISSEAETGTFFRYRKALANRGDLIGAFCYMRLQNGERVGDMATVLPRDEVEKIRSRSETYRTLTQRVMNAETEKDKTWAEKTFSETPWVLWDDVMWAKSAIRRHCSQFPLSPVMQAAASIDGAADENRFDASKMGDPEYAKAVIAGEIDAPRTGEDAEDAEYDEETGEIKTPSLAAPAGEEETAEAEAETKKTTSGGRKGGGSSRKGSTKKTEESETTGSAAAKDEAGTGEETEAVVPADGASDGDDDGWPGPDPDQMRRDREAQESAGEDEDDKAPEDGALFPEG